MSAELITINENTRHFSYVITTKSRNRLTHWSNSISSFSIVMNEEEEEYKVNDILNNRYHYDKLQYKMIWIDYLSNKAWYLAKNFQNHSKEILNNYHQRYFTKLKSNMRLIIIIEIMLSQWIRNKHKKANQLIQNVLNKMKVKMKRNDRKRLNQIEMFINTFDRKKTKICLNTMRKFRFI